MRWIVIAITVKKNTILFPCGGLRGVRVMDRLLNAKMDKWIEQGDDISMFKYATMLYVMALKEDVSKLEEIQEYAECIAYSLNDIEFARCKKEITQLVDDINE